MLMVIYSDDLLNSVFICVHADLSSAFSACPAIA